MKKIICGLLIFVCILGCMGCGKTEYVDKIEYVDNYRSININRLTNENLTLYHKDSYSGINFELAIIREVYCSPEMLYKDTFGVYGIYGAGSSNRAAKLVMDIKEIREYKDFVLAIYDFHFRYDLIEKADGWQDADPQNIKQIDILNYSDCYWKSKDTVKIDILLFN